MNKSELIDQIAEKSGLNKTEATRALNCTIDAITNAMSKGDSVVLTGFGTFAVKDRPARTGRNPSSGATMEIAACKVPGFKTGKTLKDAVN